ncbi:MAG: decaprenyl-phosphate phosphoribosyltransferase, partial [Bacteroidota bacterium]
VNISSWLILTTLFLSLFLAVMKRRVEIATSEKAVEQRNVLKDYSLSFIDQISSITGGGVIFSYALYTVSERTVQMFGSEYFAATTIFVIFGIFRYMYLVFKKDKGENVVDALITDLPMIINAFFYICTVIIFIYNR